MRSARKLEVKTPEQLRVMRRAGLVVAAALNRIAQSVQPGITTADLDAIAVSVLRENDAAPSFLGYHGYPAVVCVSVNDEVVHGIPGPRTLHDGDIVSIDFGAIVTDNRGQGWHGDAAVTVFVGEASAEDAALSDVTRSALWAGLAAAQAGGRLSDIGAAVEGVVRAAPHPYGILADYTGHGIGTQMHLPPSVENFGPAGRGPVLQPGLALAVEPMVTIGSPDTDVLEDDWTVVTQDGSRACHWEHTVAVTSEGPWVLTEPDGGAAMFAAMGVDSPAASRD
ncbi:MAG: type I methionyl aminopeptidase [Actinomycetales bacterium]|nr:type I methionyl aminopeptidase [Actinomycetales bacterium]